MTRKISLILFSTALVFCLGFYLIMPSADASESTGTLTTGIQTGMEGIVISAPSASPAAGTYSATQSVSLSASGSTKICYTTNGDTPVCASPTTCTTGTAYSTAISISSATTLKAVSCYSNGSSSTASSNAYAFVCSTSSVANGSVAAYPTCTITCNSNYTLSGSSCLYSGGGGGGGGGSGTTVGYCSSVVYADWQSNCVGTIQNRSILSSIPSGCTLTSAQQLAAQRTCPVTTTTTTTITTPIVTTTPSGDTVLENIASESGIMATNNVNTLLNHLGGTADSALEQAGLIKYKKILDLDKTISSAERDAINDFIVYGTATTQRLGAGERAAVINSYFQAYGKLPNSEAEWSDVIKIANGRWPVERSAKAEAQAKLEFAKVYLRNANMSNNIDENAIMVIAYGLLPLQRNLNSEKAAIKTFKYVYNHAPVNALAWNIVRAIAYSGAKR